MTSSVNGKKQCVTCHKSSGIMICDGCQQTFCGKHSIEHRQELANQLDGIMQQHDLLLQDLGKLTINHSLLEQINKWEEESITRIQVAAELARTDLSEKLEKSKERITKACHEIAVNIRSSREADDFSEFDLNEWMKQLKELKLEVLSPPSIRLSEDKCSVIPMIAIRNSSFIEKMSVKSKRHSTTISRERFSQCFGAVVLADEDLTARHIGCRGEYVLILGERQYSAGRQMIRLMIKFDRHFYDTYLGCISSRAHDIKISYSSPFAVGWFGCNEIYQHGACKVNYEETGYDSSKIETNDILCVIFDCDKRQIELLHERTNKVHVLAVNPERAPLPWQLLIILARTDDCVKILHCV